MNCAIMQPTFNPWIGYFDLIDYVDKFILFDTVQLNQQSWQTRNKIKAQNKESLISIPIIKSKSKNELLIKDALIDFRKYDFRKKLLKTIEQNYTKSKYYNEVHSFIKELILYDTNYLSCYNTNIIKKICKKLKINTEIDVLSETEYVSNVKKGEQVLDICQYYKIYEYISPIGSKAYLDNVSDDFKSQKIIIQYQNYNHPSYTQLGDSFIPYIGIFDLLYNEGFDNSIKIIKSGRSFIK
ncbi:WbqC-like protein [Sulfurimonas gotlandica GD1]|uniref:WbqC-like protein n=1 Tax=Sulfurimonas gotlandica (strain DSM 19862 / JCM 16533 / GD1) TaxID=929558 RepID=B6BKJ0_SULGG|nr:WbqC family protein [Sulfurimonas gotlandica]EDZ62454.1 WbqC-like protein family [Sulfurimonas gotlandica GD1]EHP29045.1 WbqC-like protein [Sulfurimonas gotlandica GD1]